MEKKRRYKPITEYKPHNHGGKPNPTTVIDNLFNISSDDSRFHRSLEKQLSNIQKGLDNLIEGLEKLQRLEHNNISNTTNNHSNSNNSNSSNNSSYVNSSNSYSNNTYDYSSYDYSYVSNINNNALYNSLKEVNIEDKDIVTLVGNPFLNTINNWEFIPQEKKTIIINEYPELPELASMKQAWDISNNVKNLDKGTVEDATLDVINTVMFVKTVATKTVQGIYYGSKKLATNVANLFTSRPVVKTIVKNETKLEKVTITLKRNPNMPKQDFKKKFKVLNKEARKGNLIVTKDIQRNQNNARKLRNEANKEIDKIKENNPDKWRQKKECLKRQDVDHKVDLQLGGKDEPGNMWMLDKHVNRGVGKQIQDQIKNCPEGTKVTKVTKTK